MPILLKAAVSAQEKNEVYKLRYKVFVEEEKRFEYPPDKIFDFYDTLDETVNFIAMEEGEVVGALRMTADNPMGMPASEHYDFSSLIKSTPGGFAGIGWLCIAEQYRRHRGILVGLFKMVFRETKKRGIRNLIAPLHPKILPLLKWYGAKAIDDEFFSKELQVPMVPIHVAYAEMPPGKRELTQDPQGMILQDSNERRIYRQGESIVEKGMPGNEAFLIMRGSVEILAHPEEQSTDRHEPAKDRKEIEANPLLGQGQVFGELSLLDGGPRTVTVVCHSKEVDVMVWTREQFYKQLRGDHEKTMKLCKMLGNRLRKEAEGYSTDRASDALVATILIDASREGQKAVNLGWLASQSGIWLKEMKELAAEWTDQGLVRCEDGRTLGICDLERLKKMRIWD